MKTIRFLVIAWLACFCFGGRMASAADDAHRPVLTLDPGTHTGIIRQLAVDPAERIVVTASDDKTARIWDLPSGRLRGTLHPPIGGDSLGRLYAAAVSPEGTIALGGTTAPRGGAHRIYFYAASNLSFQRAIDARGGDVKRLAWSPDGRLLAAAYAGEHAVRLFDRQGNVVFEESLPAESWCLAFAPDGTLAVSSSDGLIRLYRTAGPVRSAGTFRTSLKDPRGVAFSPDGRLLAVGYLSRTGVQDVRIDVFDAGSGKLVKSVPVPELERGNLRNLAWQRDGRALYAGGSGYRQPWRFMIERISWPDGVVTEIQAARNSIMDLTPLSDNRVLFASGEGNWGVVQGDRAQTLASTRSAQMYSGNELAISDDGTTVSWPFVYAGEKYHFSVGNRSFGKGSGQATRMAIPSNERVAVDGWRNEFQASIAGVAVQMEPSEISRSASVLPDGSGVVLATSRTLRRFAPSGREQWRVPLSTEARAVNVSADSRLAVIAMSDGTIRWRRTSDGGLLMSLFATPDGQWLLWTEDGYFDAGVGAETLVGWTVNRPGDEQADYFPLSRFRERYYRPDVIDRVLGKQDVANAVTEANNLRRQQAQQAEASTRQLVAQLVAPPPVKQVLPPVVTLLSPLVVASSDGKVSVEYKVFVPDNGPPAAVTARVDGRPLKNVAAETSSHASGEAVGRLKLTLPERDAVVQLFATNANGTSAPATFEYRYQAPPRPTQVTQAPATQPSPPAPPATAPGKQQPKLYLLAIGINEFANAKINLNLAGKDATDFTASLKKQEGLFYQTVEARVLANKAATRSAILSNLEWLKSAPGPDDIGVLFLAGHGVNDVDDTYYFLPHDVDVNRLASTAVAEGAFREVLANMRGKTLFFVDTCYAGKSIGILSQTDLTRIANKFSSPEHGVIVFSASHGRQQSLESPDWGNGAFTKVLVAGLDGGADYRRQGLITHRGLDYYVGYEVAALTQGMQTPVTMVPTGIADFPIAKDVTATRLGAKPP